MLSSQTYSPPSTLSLLQHPEAAHVTLGAVVFGIISSEFSKENVENVYKELALGQVHGMLPEISALQLFSAITLQGGRVWFAS